MWRGWKAASIGLGLLAGALVLPMQKAAAQNVKADVSVNTAGGYARIVFNFSEDVESDVRMSGGVLIVSFKQPVDVGVDRLTSSADYISAARRDPGGQGVRIALARKVRINSMVAGERLFVDLLPESWTGPPPSLPQEVIEDLSKRMREAERRAKQQQVLERQRPVTTNRVRVSRQPTFTRYIFELPELIAVNADRAKDKLTLTFGAPLKFDLADAKLMQPQAVDSLDVDTQETATTVSFAFIGTVEARTFREDNNYVVDVLIAAPAGNVEGPATAPAVEKNAEASPSVPAMPAQADASSVKPQEPPVSDAVDAAAAPVTEASACAAAGHAGQTGRGC